MGDDLSECACPECATLCEATEQCIGYEFYCCKNIYCWGMANVWDLGQKIYILLVHLSDSPPLTFPVSSLMICRSAHVRDAPLFARQQSNALGVLFDGEVVPFILLKVEV